MRHLIAVLTVVLGAIASAQAQTDFPGSVARLRAQAQGAGITAATFDRAMANVEFDATISELLNNQPEFRTPIWDYLAALVDDERIADGAARLKQWDTVLAQAEQKFGVDRYTITAVWGVESDYGKTMGSRPLVRSLATLACGATRANYFRGELFSTLQIIQRGDIRPEVLVGSWAGAFGHTQFMPSTFHSLAVDFDGDDRRDIVESVPDALGSTANYLRRSGWISGATWGYEVKLPAGYADESGRTRKRALTHWSSAGITRLTGGALTGTGDAGLMLPAGPKGPAFLVFKNFEAIYAYNHAESYALAIAHLADRLRGGAPFATAWPTDDRGLSRAERREVQQLLNERGFDVGATDGLIGSRTQAAINAFQEKAGLPVMGRAGGRVLEALRRK